MADRRLQVFHAVATHLSFTRAAEALFMTQPAVTFQIRQLEDECQTRLFERRHGGVSLTGAGQLVLDYARRILALQTEMDTRLAELTDAMRGSLQIGATQALAGSSVPVLLADFNARHPQVQTRLIVGNSEQLESRVRDGSLDLALLEGAPTQPGVDALPLGEDPLYLICSPDHPLAGQKAVTAKQLREYEFIAREPGSATRQQMNAFFAAAGVAAEALKVVMEVGSLATLLALVQSGLGCAIVPRPALPDGAERRGLVALPLKPARLRPVSLVLPQTRFRSRLIQTFIEFSQQKLRELKER
ncbi:MAG: hypothetical protein RIR00_295 [Pseudomonadota bacterium]